jgi:predicted nucleotidyltransferase component of viral defense system
VRQRLLNLARSKGEAFQYVAEQYALERLLYRLGVSEYAQRFLLKGAMLFRLWHDEPHRRTRDADLLGFGSADVGELEGVFRHVCAVEAEDGVRFDPSSIRGEEIREGMAYQGVRIRLRAELAGARLPVQLDIGFGDVVVPAPEEVDYPVMLDFPAPRLRVYSRYSVVAEKLEAIVRFGEQNSRMKDFYDVFVLSEAQEFDGAILQTAIQATFERRSTVLPAELPTALTVGFAMSERVAGLWAGFLKRSGLEAKAPALGWAIQRIGGFLDPVLKSARSGEEHRAVWIPGGPWRPRP